MTKTEARHEAVVDKAIYEAHVEARKAEMPVEFGRKHPGHYSDEEMAEALKELHRTTCKVAEAESNYTGWSRFYLVTNSNGHIHSSMHCSTCYWDTSFAWLTELSGLTEAEAVAEYGEILCSICYPSAPVEWTNGVNKKLAAERDLHKALLAIERSPEGKKVKSARELVNKKARSIEWFELALTRFAEWGDDAPEWMANDAAKAEATLPKRRKELARAEAKLEAAEAALEAALGL